MKFNAKSRKTNAMLASVGGVIEQMAYIIVSFIFRTVFLRIFTEEYLGLSGLFTNIIQIFSLAELGIGSAIVYRAYAPIKENDTTKIAALMDFYKNIYRIIFGVIIFAGILFMPFLSVIIKEPSEIPADINIQLVYMLFVLQSASSYLYVYKQSVLQADQKAYAVSTVGTVNNIMTNLVKIAMLYLTKDYVLVLVSGIVTSLFINIIFNFYITKKV